MTTPDTLDLFAQRRNSTLNTVHTWLLVAGSLALLAVTAWAFGGTAGIIYALVFGGISMWLVRRVSPQMVLSMYKARAVSAAEFPAGIRIVAELSRRAGLTAVPKLYVIPSKLMNAFAVGRRDDSVIAITDALARTLTTRELAGVLAHEISHVAHEDIRVMALADMVSRFTSLMSTVGIISLFLNIGSYASGAGGSVPWLAVAVLLAVADRRRAAADGAVANARVRCRPRRRHADRRPGRAGLGARQARAHARAALGKMVLPGGRTPDPSVLRTHPLTADRIARLNQLKTTAASGCRRSPGRAGGRPAIAAARVAGAEDQADAAFRRVRPAAARRGRQLRRRDQNSPASDRPLNPPEGEPRIHFRRGAVWW